MKKDLEGFAPREIKFRAWSGGHMISPDYIDREGYAWWRENSIPSNTRSMVMQFTSLKDVHGQEIFEGDILEFSPGDYYNLGRVLRGAVVFLGGSFGMELGQDKSWHDLGQTIADDGGAKVLGNIYESPELLQKGEAREAEKEIRGEASEPSKPLISLGETGPQGQAGKGET